MYISYKSERVCTWSMWMKLPQDRTKTYVSIDEEVYVV